MIYLKKLAVQRILAYMYKDKWSGIQGLVCASWLLVDPSL